MQTQKRVTDVKWRMHTVGGGGWMDCEVQWMRMESL